MKKLRVLLLCAAMLVLVAGCESTKWIEEAADKIDEDIASGEFVLEGEEFSFPMMMEDWLDNEWHVSNNYDNTDVFTLEPGGLCEEFEVFRDDDNKQYVSIVAWNDGVEDAKIPECAVYSVSMRLDKNDAVFPQGISKRSNEEDIIDAYGEPAAEYEEDGFLYLVYWLDSEEMGYASVTFKLNQNTRSDEKVAEVLYELLDFEQTFGILKKSQGVEQAIEVYLNAEEKAYFYGDTKDYVRYSLGSQAIAEQNYEYQIGYYISYLCEYLEMYSEYLTDEDLTRLEAIAKASLAKAKWEVAKVKVDGDTATVTMHLYPTDLLEIADEDIFDAVDAFYTKYEDADFEEMSDSEYEEAEKYYISLILDALEKNVANIGTLDKEVYELEMDAESFEFAEEYALGDVDDILMNIQYEEE